MLHPPNPPCRVLYPSSLNVTSKRMLPTLGISLPWGFSTGSGTSFPTEARQGNPLLHVCPGCGVGNSLKLHLFKAVKFSYLSFIMSHLHVTWSWDVNVSVPKTSSIEISISLYRKAMSWMPYFFCTIRRLWVKDPKRHQINPCRAHSEV